MEAIQTAEFPTNVVFIILGIIFWIYKAVKANKEKQNAKKANFEIDDQIRNKINETKTEDLYQKKLEEYAKRKAEKIESKEKEHILQSYTSAYETTPTYQDKLVANQYASEENNYHYTEVEQTETNSKYSKTTDQSHGFKQYQSKKQTNKLGKFLHNKSNLKQAIILSEVLKRKY